MVRISPTEFVRKLWSRKLGTYIYKSIFQNLSRQTPFFAIDWAVFYAHNLRGEIGFRLVTGKYSGPDLSMYRLVVLDMNTLRQ